MDELENRLNSNNPVLIAQIFSKIIINIRNKQKSGQKEILEIVFLKDKSILNDPLISGVAGGALLNLIESGDLALGNTLTEFITLIPSTKHLENLTNLIGNLLYFELNSFKKNLNIEHKYGYNLSFPQHPYVTILHANAQNCSYIYNAILYLYEKAKADTCTDKFLELFYPVFLYTLCNPTSQLNNVNLFKHRIWAFLLHENKNLLYQILCWMQVQTINNLEVNSELLIEGLLCTVNGKNYFNIEILILWQASILVELTINRKNIRSNIFGLRKILYNIKHLSVINPLVLLFTQVIDSCSILYLEDVLNICEFLIKLEGISLYVLKSLQASLLNWLAFPCLLTENAVKIANRIFVSIDKHESNEESKIVSGFLDFSETYKKILDSNATVYTSIAISLLLPHLNENLSNWIDDLKSAPHPFIETIFHFLSGIILVDNLRPDVFSKLLSIMLSCSNKNVLSTNKLLTLVLYKLSHTTESETHFVLLKSLPKMINRDSIPKVMAALQALSKGSEDLFNFSLSLTYEAWNINNKCYPYLETMLNMYESKQKQETYITKTFILKELCKQKPELYGKDIVAHLSKVLNECNNDDGSVACAMALDGITLLCKSEIIDVVTTWVTLSPKFKRDRRLPVVKSLCALIHEIPLLNYTESYADLIEDVLKTLWEYISLGDSEISKAALESLSSFNLEHISLHLPDIYLEDPSEDKKQETTIKHLTVPGRTWIKFLKQHCASKEAGDFLIKLISIEVKGYLKYVYQVKGNREPVNYDYLPSHSIVRGLAEYIKKWASKWKGSIDEKLYIESLRIFSAEYSKPLPPMDWCFLQEVMEDSRTKRYCINLASHQVTLSGTARRLMENYIEAVTQNHQEEDIKIIFKNLKYLANSIQPATLKPFIENSFNFSIKKFNTEYENQLLEEIIVSIINVLQNKDIQDTNKKTIANVLDNIISITEIGSELFNAVLRCVIVLPQESIEEIASVQVEHTEEKLLKSLKIRTYIAKSSTCAPLNWLNKIIETPNNISSEKLLQEFKEVFRKQIVNTTECVSWLLDLIGRIEVKVADRCSQKEISIVFDIFLLAVVEFSGYYVFDINNKKNSHDKLKALFPQALSSLLKVNEWSICTEQILEWLFHMNSEETVIHQYQNTFGYALRNLRHDECFIRNFRWMKYLGSKVDITIS